jgi:ABC-2 type transport system ATP-binding protein
MAELKQQHRIRAILQGEWTNPPPNIADQLTILRAPHGHVTLETPSPLAPLLGWLATLPLADVRIEPIGLRAVYDRFHPSQSTVGTL